ncbi:MAG: hypothetical protein FIA94_03755 [Nitrospirae bacterium]|nr:hypothetical protein [Nitrospirota bacterium]
MANRNNYAAKLELKKQNKSSAGLISERFPEVADIAIHMTYYQNGSNNVLMVRKVNIFPSSYAYFKMDCMTKGCEDGGFDLTPVIKGMIKERKKGKKGALDCRGKFEAADDGHAHVEYEIVMRYNKSSR